MPCIDAEVSFSCVSVLIFFPLLSHDFLAGIEGLSGSSACCWYNDEDIPDINSLHARFVFLSYSVPIAAGSSLHMLFVYVYVFLAYSLGEKFTPLAAYVPTGPDALAAHVYEDPVEMIMEVLKDVDPFTDMVNLLCFRKLYSVHVILGFIMVLMLVSILSAEIKFLCTVTVNRLGSYQRWWFSSSSLCRKSAKHDGYQYECSGENCFC
jgi:hypothetical protein